MHHIMRSSSIRKSPHDHGEGLKNGPRNFAVPVNNRTTVYVYVSRFLIY